MQKQLYFVRPGLWSLGKVGSNAVMINTLTPDLPESLMGVSMYEEYSCHLQFSFCKRNGRGELLLAVGLSKAVRRLSSSGGVCPLKCGQGLGST